MKHNLKSNWSRQAVLGLWLIGGCCLVACQKQLPSHTQTPDLLISQARTHFQSVVLPAVYRPSIDESTRLNHPRKYVPHLPAWDQARVVQFSGSKAVLIPVTYGQPFLMENTISGNNAYNAGEVSKLLIYQDAGQQFHTELVTFFPDSAYPRQYKQGFTGLALVEDWYGNSITSYLFQPGGVIKKRNGNADSPQAKLAPASGPQSNTICLYVTGYNYSADDPTGYYWSESLGCQTFYSESQGGQPGPGGSDYGGIGGLGDGSTGGSGGAPFNPYGDFSVTGADNPIGNIKDYIKCFINVPGNDHHYQVALCVSQPEPGSRTPWETTYYWENDNNPFYVGHTYLILTETTPTQTIIRNIGFYPQGIVTPITPVGQGVLNNDGLHRYDIKLTVTMNNSQFFDVLNYISLANAYPYNLNSNNCTTFAINALTRAGFRIPATRGNWLNGSGNNPGDLGEDIREMPLGSNMARTTTYGTHPNKGTCQ